MEVYFWSGLRVANDSGVPPVIKVTFPPRAENATAVDAVQEANENFYNILALSVGITGTVLLLALVLGFWYRNRQAERARRRYFSSKLLNMNVGHAPQNGECGHAHRQLRPIYRPPPSNNNTLRQPPEYKESLMEDTDLRNEDPNRTDEKASYYNDEGTAV